MAQHRYLPPAYRNLGSTRSRILQTVQGSPRASHICREVTARIDELLAAGIEPDAALLAEDDVVKMLVAEIATEMWSTRA